MDQLAPVKNGILARLSADDLAYLREGLVRVELPLRQHLSLPNREIEHVYFIERGIASIVATVGRDDPIEVGIVGWEGLAGLPVVMGTDRSPNQTYMQAAGHGQRIEAGLLRDAMAKSATLQHVLQQYAHVFMTQTAYTVLANGRATIPERLARWLLMAHDRFEGDELPLTHEFLSLMLGVRRAGVTTALKELEHQKVVERRRGAIAIVDRAGLQSAAHGYYGTAEQELHRLFGQ